MILGVDFGEKKSGLATCQQGIVEPYKVIKTDELEKMIKDERLGLEKIVIGLPEGKLKNKVLELGEKYKKLFQVEVIFFDETLSTLDAQQILGTIKRKRSYKKEMEDAVAAAVMLERYCQSY